MKRSRYGALLAGVSATAILVGTSGTALAGADNTRLPASVLTNSGTITNGVTVTDAGTVTEVVNQRGGTISNGGGAAFDSTGYTWEIHLTNSGTITGDIKLGVPTSGDPLNLGDHMVYLNAGSVLNGNIIPSQANTANVDIGFAGAGTATITGSIGANGVPIHSFGLANGATLAFTQDSQIHIGNLVMVYGGGYLDAGTSKIDLYHYDSYLKTHQEGDGTTLYLKTTLNTTNGQHGYFTFTQSTSNADPTKTLLNGSTPVIVATVVGSVAQGSKYIIVQDKDNTAGFSTPTVSNSGGIRWVVSSVTGSGQTDTDGISYGTGYKDIIITASGNTNAAAATGTNGKAVSAIASYSGTNAAMQSLSNAVNNLTSDTEIQKAGAQLRPEVNGGTTQASLGATNQALGTIQIRSDGVRTAAADQTGISSGETLRGLGVWGQGFGSYASQDRRQDVDGYTAGTYGLAFGADARVLDAVRVGVSFAYARTNVDDTGSRDGSGQKINSYIGSLYGTYTANSWYVDGALTYGRHDYDATRVVNFTGATPQVAKASFAGQQYGAKAEFGYPLSVGPAVVTPLASLAYNRLNQDGYTETGAAGANLTVGSSATDSVRSGLGGKVSTTIAQAGEWNIKPNARAMWLHEFSGSAPDQTSTFVAGGSSFTTSGITVAQEHFNLGVGLDVASVRNTTVSAKYDADLSDRYVSHTGSLQVRTEF
jgi:outer membrane autotransporter protein